MLADGLLSMTPGTYGVWCVVTEYLKCIMVGHCWLLTTKIYAPQIAPQVPHLISIGHQDFDKSAGVKEVLTAQLQAVATGGSATNGCGPYQAIVCQILSCVSIIFMGNPIVTGTVVKRLTIPGHLSVMYTNLSHSE